MMVRFHPPRCLNFSKGKMDLDQIIDSISPPPLEGNVPCSFTTGAAGTGKTYSFKKKIEEEPAYGILAATTGISAINLGAVTLNSLLKFFDTDSLRDNFNRGNLTTNLHRLGKISRNLIIDEVSMMDGRQLDYIYEAVSQVNEYKDMESHPMGIILTGDFAQLPPVNAQWAFEAVSWPNFDDNTTKLTKVWRQENPEFLEAINAARIGDGSLCASILSDIGVRFIPSTTKDFKGTTIMSKNNQVDNFNFSALLDLPGEFFGLKSQYWGYEDKNWRRHIPDVLKLKIGAYVMILNNDFQEGYVNGDCGNIVEKDENGTISVKLVRGGRVVRIRPIVRNHQVSFDEGEKLGYGDPFEASHVGCHLECQGWDGQSKRWVWGRPSYNCQRGTWNDGGVMFYPLRASYATTCHKSQGLTLDKCQIDIRDQFFGNPSMTYVALSRVKSPDGLTIVGDPQTLASRIKIDEKVRKWL